MTDSIHRVVRLSECVKTCSMRFAFWGPNACLVYMCIIQAYMWARLYGDGTAHCTMPPSMPSVHTRNPRQAGERMSHGSATASVIDVNIADSLY